MAKKKSRPGTLSKPLSRNKTKQPTKAVKTEKKAKAVKAKKTVKKKKRQDEEKEKRDTVKSKRKSLDLLAEVSEPVPVPDQPVPEQEHEHKRDKIFGNDFNTGNVEMFKFPDVQVETVYANKYLDDVYNADDYMDKKSLMEDVYNAFKKSQWKSMMYHKKFPKELMPYIFQDLYSAVIYPGRSAVDIVIAIAEFMDISSERAYEIAGLRIKEALIKELEGKYQRLKNKKINRLF
jgi:hypothetical protein